MKTFLDLQKEVARYYDLAAEITEAPEGADVEMIKSSLNQANSTRLTEDKWKFTLSTQFTLNTVADVQDYILPHTNYGRWHFLWNDTDKVFARKTPPRNVPNSMVDFNQSVSNDLWSSYDIIKDGSVVLAQPATPATLTLTTSGSEPNAPELYIVGEDADGNEINDSLAKDEVSTNVYTKITYYAKTADFDTTLTLTATGGATLLVLNSDEYAKRYPVVHFYTIPVNAKTYKYKFFRNPRLMVRDFDIPDLPFPHSNILVYDTLLDLATFNELDSESIGVWRDKQQKLMENLYLEKLEADALSAVPETINSI